MDYLNTIGNNFIANFTPTSAGAFLAIYTSLQVAVRVIAPPPLGAKALKNPKKQSALYYGEIISILHACLSITFILYAWIAYGVRLGSSNHQPYLIILEHQCAYFLIDFVFSKLYGYDGTMQDVHHIMSFIGSFMIFFMQYGAAEGLIGVFLAQISNPCLQTRNTLRRLGRTGSRVYDYLQYIFVFIFLLFRLVLPVPTILMVARPSTCPLLLLFCCCSIYSLSMIWNLQIINLLWKTVKAYLTDNGKVPLTSSGQVVDDLVKVLVFGKYSKHCMAAYCLCFYYLLPGYLYVLPRFL